MARLVKFTSNIDQWTLKQEKQNDLVVLRMASDIHRIASLNAPYDQGILVRSGRIVRNGLANYSIVFGGGRVQYAKRRHYENRKNPSTLLYLERAGDSVSKDFNRYYSESRW